MATVLFSKPKTHLEPIIQDADLEKQKMNQIRILLFTETSRRAQTYRWSRNLSLFLLAIRLYTPHQIQIPHKNC